MDFLDFTAGSDLTKHKVEPKSWMTEKRFVLVTCPDGQTSPLLAQAVDNCIAKGHFALDLETTGLDNRVFSGETRDKIVGVCLSHDGVTGYYVPLRHRDEEGNPSPHNLPMHVFRAEFERLMASPAVAVFHKGKFDQEFLQFNGGKAWREWDKADEWEDTLILAYLRDTRAMQKGLKFLSKTELGMEMIELNELFGSEKKSKHIDYDFSKLDPTADSTLWYACADAICTYLLYEKLYPQVVFSGEGSQKSIYKIEKWCVAATRWMERDRVHIDKAKVAELIDLGQKELFDSLCDVYTTVSAEMGRDITPFYFLYAKEMIRVSNPDLSITSGTDSLQGLLKTCREMAGSMVPETNFPALAKYRGRQGVEKRGKHWPAEYDVMSAQQLGVLLDEMEVQGLERTEKSGQVKTDSDSLDALLEEQGDKVPWLKKIQRFRETQKALSTYLIPLWEDSDPTDDTVKIDFNGHKTDTGRFSAPASSDPKKDGGTRFPAHGTPATYDPSRPECLGRIRECITARDGKFIVAIDFSGEELRIITNLSGEPKWLTEFFRCSSCGMAFDRGDGTATPPAPPPFCPKCGSDKIGDIHTLTALSLYGDDAPKRADWKQLRGNAKGTNFALCYGGSGKAVVRSTGVDDNEGARIKQAFDSSYTTLSSWWKRTQDYGRQHGFVLTAFGRKYPVPDIQLPRWGTNNKGERVNNGGFIAKAERNAVNGPIQGCLHGDSRVPTDLGVLPIKDLSGKTFRVWTGTDWEEAWAFASGPKKLNYTNLSSGGTIKTSPDHRFLTYNQGLGWTHQRDLQVGTWVAVDAYGGGALESPLAVEAGPKTVHNSKTFSLESNKEELWEILGLVIGDGSIKEDGLTIHVGGSDAQAQALWYQERFNSALPALGATVKKKDRAAKESHKLPMWQVHFYNRAFLRFCYSLGLGADWTTHTKRIPKAVWEQAPQYRAAFLRGYFSADGCVNSVRHVDVRSANLSLLEDTYGLLGSLGIRATHLPKSLRVSVKDISGFKKKIGFLDPKKQTRLEQIPNNPWSGQWHALPPELVTQVGHLVKGSSIYKGLPRAQKSAVLRLCVGSGSKPQCLAYLAKVPEKEVPEGFQEALKYNYERVVGVEETGATVEMFDIEVFDHKHAFVCDGVIVHNSGADIIKLAMWLVYKECKDRNWFGRVSMILTVHDELVFEIDKEILEEAINVISDLMCNNHILKALKWRVPLTCDIEAGPNWMVQWHITKMMHGKKKWADELKPYFPKAVSVIEGTVAATPTDAADTMAKAASPAAAATSPDNADPKPSNGVYTHTVSGALTALRAMRLGEIIAKCNGKGTSKLRLATVDGTEIDYGGTVLVNHVEFKVWAREAGL